MSNVNEVYKNSTKEGRIRCPSWTTVRERKTFYSLNPLEKERAVEDKIALANRSQGLTTRISKRTMDITDNRGKRDWKKYMKGQECERVRRR